MSHIPRSQTGPVPVYITIGLHREGCHKDDWILINIHDTALNDSLKAIWGIHCEL